MSDKLERELERSARTQKRQNEDRLKSSLGLHKKAMQGGGRRPAPKRSTRGRAARATRGAGSWVKAGKAAPALLCQIHKGEGSIYAEKQAGSWHVGSNMLGRCAADRAAEFELDCAMHPRVNKKNMLIHVSISRAPDEEAMTPEAWHDVIREWLKNIGAEGCNYTATGHSNTDNEHVHIYFSRAKPDGTLVSMSHNRWAWRAALRLTEQRFGIATTERSRPADTPTPTSDAMVNAQRRAARRGTRDGYVDPNVVKKALDSAGAYEQFVSNCKAHGYEVNRSEKNGKVTGILYRRTGSEEFLAGGSISRELTLPKVLEKIDRNRLASLQKREQEHHSQRQRQAEQQRALEQAQKQRNFERERGG